MTIVLNGKLVEVRTGDTRQDPDTLRGYISACCQMPVEIKDDSEPATGFNSFTLTCFDCDEVLEPKDVIEEVEVHACTV